MFNPNLEHKYGGMRALRKVRSHTNLSRAEYRELGIRKAQEHANQSPFQIKTLSKWRELIISEDTSKVIPEKKEMSEEERRGDILLNCLYLLSVDSDDGKDGREAYLDSEDVGSEDQDWDRLMERAEKVSLIGEMESQLAEVCVQQKQMTTNAIFEIAKIWAFMSYRDLMSDIFPRDESPFL